MAAYGLEELDLLDILDEIEVIRRPRRVFNDRRNDMFYLDDYEFLQQYRLTIDTVDQIIEMVRPRLEPTTEKNQALSPTLQVLLALRFYATGTFQIVCGDLNNSSQKTCSRVVQRVSTAIADLRPQFIQFPRNEGERQEVAQGFHAISGFPCGVGAIDCTHVRIQSPGGDNAERFRNRKGYFSINVQTVSDSYLRIMDLVVRWPGSTHDTPIFDNSHLRARFEAGEIPPVYHLIGDNGYPCRNYLMTPLLDTHSRSQELYNQSHIQARNPVERQYGVWKRLFPCMSIGLRCNLDTCLNIVVATGVLFNIAMKNGVYPDRVLEDDPQVPQNENITNIQVPVVYDIRHARGFAKRNAIIRDFFT